MRGSAQINPYGARPQRKDSNSHRLWPTCTGSGGSYGDLGMSDADAARWFYGSVDRTAVIESPMMRLASSRHRDRRRRDRRRRRPVLVITSRAAQQAGHQPVYRLQRTDPDWPTCGTPDHRTGHDRPDRTSVRWIRRCSACARQSSSTRGPVCPARQTQRPRLRTQVCVIGITNVSGRPEPTSTRSRTTQVRTAVSPTTWSSGSRRS